MGRPWTFTGRPTLAITALILSLGKNYYFYFILNFYSWLGLIICSILNTASSAASQIPLGLRMLGLNLGLLQIFIILPGALTPQLDLIHDNYISSRYKLHVLV
jgi:hypothetical protein